MSKIIWIDETLATEGLYEEALVDKVVAIDLESNSMFSYYQEISLLQIKIQDTNYLIDTIKLGIPNDIKNILLDENIIKVFQDMQFDLSLLYDNYNLQPKGLFDISIADRLIRKTYSNYSLDKLVKTYLNKKLMINKTIQKSNWAIRPLNNKQIYYASNDVDYLIDLYRVIYKKISEDYRIDFFQEYMKHPSITVLKRKFNINFMWKIKGVQNLNIKQLNQLREFLILRDEICQKWNKPPHWLWSEFNIMKIIKLKPKNSDELESLLPNGKWNYILDKYKSQIYNIYNMDNDHLSDLKKPAVGTSLKRWIPESNGKSSMIKGNPNIIKRLKEWIDLVSNNLNLLPEFIFDKSQLSLISTMHPNELEKNSFFIGIPEKYKRLFIDDLILFFEKGISIINPNMLKK